MEREWSEEERVRAREGAEVREGERMEVTKSERVDGE